MPGNMEQSFVETSVGEVMLNAHTAKAPDDREWDRLIQALKVRDVEKLRTLVFTEGGAPTTPQRKLLNETLGGKQSKGAVISPSALVRGVVTALSWFNPKICAFSPHQLDEAFAYLGVTDPKDIGKIRAAMKDLRARLGDETLRSIAKSVG